MTTNPAKVTIFTLNGPLTISKISNGIAYDQNGNPIADRAFRYNPNILKQDWVKPENQDIVTIPPVTKTEFVTA
jgi:hypothetical protein